MTDVEKFRLSLLMPSARARAEGVIARMVTRGFREPYVGHTMRTPEEQAEALRRGTTGRKQKNSWHFQFHNEKTGERGARAVDFRDRLPNGKPDPTTRNELFFLALWEEATAIGLRCLGFVRDTKGHPVKLYINGGKLWDAGHCEYRAPYKSLTDALAAEAPHVLEDDDTPVDDPDDDETGARLRALGLASLPPSPFA